MKIKISEQILQLFDDRSAHSESNQELTCYISIIRIGMHRIWSI